MKLHTMADELGLAERRARPMRCPCCGRMQAADMIMWIGNVPAPILERARETLRAAVTPEWACDGDLATLHRRGIFRRGEQPGRS